jgi:outer membrane protein W
MMAAALQLVGSSSHAQTWLPEKGDIGVSLSYQNVYIRRHYLENGQQSDGGRIRAHGLILGATYSFTDRLAMSASVPYYTTKYWGKRPHQMPADDGTYHDALQDVRLEVQYQALQGSTAVTPFVGIVLPTHDYTYFAHSAVGRHLQETVVGIGAGQRLAFLDGSYVQARASHVFVQRVLGIRHDRDSLDAEFGYFATPDLALRLLASAAKTQGGVDFNRVGGPTSPLFPVHDQLLREEHLNLGAGLSYSMTPSFDVYAMAFQMVRGKNGHKIDYSMTLGVAWNCGCSVRCARKVAPR